jgi:adenylate cyclase
LQRIQNKIVVPRMLRANVRDIGYHGALLELTEPLEPHAEVKLEFDLPLVDFRVDDIYAKVVNVKAEGRGLLAGLEFTSVGPASNAKIQLFVQFLVGTH